MDLFHPKVSSGLADFRQNVHKASMDSANLEKNIGRVFQQVATGSAELAATLTKQGDLTLMQATELQNSLQNMKEGEVGPMLGAIMSQLVSELSRAHSRVTDKFQQSSNELMNSINQRQNELYEVRVPHWVIFLSPLMVSQRAQDLDYSFSGLESKAETLHAAQTRQVELQARLHNQTQIEMQASRILIANVTLSARGLYEAVDVAAAKIAKMAWVGAIPEELFMLGWLVLAIAVLHWYSPNHAKFVATVIGGSSKTIESSMLIRSHRTYDTCARLGYLERPQFDPFGPGVHPPCFRLPSSSLGAHQNCCNARCYLSNRRPYLPARECFQNFPLPHHEK